MTLQAQYTSTTTAFRLTATPASGTAFPLTDPSKAGQRPVGAWLQATTANIRFTVDGVTTPTASVGAVLAAGAAPWLYYGDLVALQFIRESAGAVLFVIYTNQPPAMVGQPTAEQIDGALGYTPANADDLTPPGSDKQVIFNDGGSFGANADLTFDKTTKVFRLIETTGIGGEVFVDNYTDTSGTIAGPQYPLAGRFTHNGTGTITGELLGLDVPFYNNSTGTITLTKGGESYHENVGNGNWGTMTGWSAHLFNDGSGTVTTAIGFNTRGTNSLSGNYGAGTVNTYIGFLSAGVNNSGTYGAVYGLKLDSQVGLTVTGKNHPINYNDTFIVDAAGNSFQTRAFILGNTAPADGALSANQCAIWFDPTNGAAKIMFKAKQADGTVKTGSVNVAT